MIQLVPFQLNSELPTVHADVKLMHDSTLFIEFHMNEVKNVSDLPPKNLMPASWTRADDLWKKTCFELFISEANSDSYTEFNFSPLGSWNSYRFEKYRTPQPPTPDYDWCLIETYWSKNILQITVKNPKQSLSTVEVSLCAVIRLNNLEIHYYSHNHYGTKPDFHLRKSLSIKRSVS